MTGVVLAVLASLAWGTADFLGGFTSRTLPVPVVLVVSQTGGVAAVAVVLAARHEPLPHDGRLLLSLAAGGIALVGLGLLYLAMAKGPLIVTAPIAAVAAVVPVVVGLARGDQVDGMVAAGIACALVGAVGGGWDQSEAGARTGSLVTGALLALAAAAAIGSFFVLFDAASAADPYWATGGLRVSGFVVALAPFLVRPGQVRAVARLPLRMVAVLVAVGLSDVCADVAFATAARHGQLSVVSVLGSLYPVFTVLLAVILLRERVRPVQLGGATLALTGVALLAGATP